MNRVLKSILGIGVLAASLLPGAASAQKFWKDIQAPPLREFQIPQPEIYTLKNGLRVFLLEDHSLPMVQASVMVRTGYLWEPKDKHGLGSITGQAMRTGGTTTRKGEEIDELLEAHGASVETGIGADSGSASMFVLAEDTKMGMEILSDLLRNPAFPADKIELAKVQERDAIARRNDDVNEVARREFRKVVYGKDSPYAAHTEFASIDAIQRDDIVAFHAQGFWPGNCILGVVGDFQTKEMKSLVEQSFGAWKNPGKKPKFEMPALPSQNTKAAYVINKDDVAQSQLRIGHIGGRRDDPDFYALEVFTEIFGGGSFNARLMQEVRTKRGLAYGVYGVWAAEYERPGMFIIGGGTKNSSTVEAMQVCIETMNGMMAAEPTAEELKRAKDSILNSFVFNFDTKPKIVDRLMEYAYHGYPMDSLQRYKKGIEAVTAADVLRVAKSHLKPDQLVYLAAGKVSEFAKPLSELGAGEPKQVDITIPGQASAGQAPASP